MNTSHGCRELLEHRARMFDAVRAFFKARNVLEVDCPALAPTAPIDLHIDVMHVESCGYLHTSPEYRMKQLLAMHSGDIYQLSHVFRAEEQGPLHHPEFTMLEWYRLALGFEEMIEETLCCIRLFLGPLRAEHITYDALLQDHFQVDYDTATPQELYALATTRGLSLTQDASRWDKDTLCQVLLGHFVEPTLGHKTLYVLTHFPASQAALAQTVDNRALRFEVYHRGIELANGYRELTDAKEQKKRLEEAHQQRLTAGKAPLPIDTLFLAALEAGLPECCGVAVGFDRLIQLQRGAASLLEVLTPTFVQSGSAVRPGTPSC